MYGAWVVFFRVDHWETEQGGWTVTAQVLRHFQEAVDADKSMEIRAVVTIPYLGIHTHAHTHTHTHTPQREGEELSCCVVPIF